MPYDSFLWTLWLTGAITAALTAYGLSQRRVPGAVVFAAVSASLSVWSIAYAFELASPTLEGQLSWLRVRYLGIVSLPPAWLVFALLYTGHEAWVTRRRLAALAGLTLGFWLVAATNQWHGLFFTDIHIEPAGAFLKWTSRYGVGYWIHVGYAYLLLTLANVLILVALVRSPRVHRGQALSLLLAVAVPWVSNVFYQLGLSPLGLIDPTPPAFSISAGVMGWALFRYGFLELVPIARDAVIEGMRDGVVVLDLNGRIVDLNPAARQLLGSTASEAIGRPFAASFPDWPDDDAPALRRGDGDAARVYEVRASPLLRGSGRPRGRMLVLADVTERQATQERLARQNQHLGALVEAGRVIGSGLELPRVLQNIAEESARLVGGDPGGIGLVRNGMVVFDSVWTDGRWEPARILFRLGEGVAGRAAATGQAQIVDDATVILEEPLGRYGVQGFIDVPILGRDAAASGVLHVRRRRGGPPFSASDRELLESLARQAAIAIENAALYGALEEKKAALEALYAKERELSRSLQAMNSMKTNFMIVTSHEMRTPLTVLRGYHEALEGGHLGDAAADKKALAICRRTAERMAASLEGILEMLRMDQGSLRLQIQPVHIDALVAEVAEELRPFAERRRQRLAIECPPALPQVAADSAKLRLVLLNLVENAIKFTPDGGSIRLVSAAAAAGVEIAVEDDGIGVEAGELERIFERFYTAADTRHHRSGRFEFESRGVGLGLAIVRGHAEAHGGRAWAESEGRGRGSRFRVWLPLGPAALADRVVP